MKRKLISVIIALSLIFSIIPVYEPVHASGIAEIIKSVSFRDQPSTSGDRIRYIQAGEKVEIIENVNTYWNKVVDQYGQVGYLTTLDRYVTVLSQPEIQTGNATILLSVSFREGPSTSYNRVRYLQAGETITILSEYSAYWYHIKDQHGQEGYVSTISKYIDASGYLDTAPEPVTNGEILKSVSFRSGPSTSYSRIRYLQTGEKVTVLDKANSYWYEVQDQYGQVGYVTTISGYMSTSFVDSDNQEPVTTTPDSGSDTNDQTKSEIIQNVINVGMKYLGTPYEFGSDRNSTATFDCSDFVRRIFIEGANITLPMDSRKQADYVSQIGQTSSDWNNLQPGDLMFFMSYKGSSSSDYEGIDKSSQTITHVSLYLGDGQVLHTYSAKSGGVKTDTIAGRHWEHRFIFGGSVIK